MNKLVEVAKKSFDDMEYKNKNTIQDYIKEQLVKMYGEEYIDEFEPYDENIVHLRNTNFYISHNRYNAPDLIYGVKNIITGRDWYDLGRILGSGSGGEEYNICTDVSWNLIKLHKGITRLNNTSKTWWDKCLDFFKNT
jgi:hypothetical protein